MKTLKNRPDKFASLTSEQYEGLSWLAYYQIYFDEGHQYITDTVIQTAGMYCYQIMKTPYEFVYKVIILKDYTGLHDVRILSEYILHE